MVWLWGVNLWVFSQGSVNYAKVFDLDHNHLTHREMWKVLYFSILISNSRHTLLCFRIILSCCVIFGLQCSMWMTIIVPTSMTAYLYLYSHGEVSLAASQPVSVFSLLLFLQMLCVWYICYLCVTGAGAPVHCFCFGSDISLRHFLLVKSIFSAENIMEDSFSTTGKMFVTPIDCNYTCDWQISKLIEVLSLFKLLHYISSSSMEIWSQFFFV